MAFDKASFTRVSTSVRPGAQNGLHFYATGDSAATVITAGYFNDVRDKVKVGDLVAISAGIGATPITLLLRFLTVPASGNVTVVDDLTDAADLAAVLAGTTAFTKLKRDAGTATATAGAATLNKGAGKVTSEALTTAAGSTYTLTITNDKIAAADIVTATVQNGTNTQGTPVITSITPAAGSVVIKVKNDHASEALNGTIVVGFVTHTV